MVSSTVGVGFCDASSAYAMANILLVTGLGRPWRLAGIVIMCLVGVTATSSCGAACVTSSANAEGNNLLASIVKLVDITSYSNS